MCLSDGTCVLVKPISSILQGKNEAAVDGWMDGWTEQDKESQKRMRRATPLTKLLNLIPQFGRELIGYTVLSACSKANLGASVQSQRQR